MSVSLDPMLTNFPWPEWSLKGKTFDAIGVYFMDPNHEISCLDLFFQMFCDPLHCTTVGEALGGGRLAK